MTAVLILACSIAAMALGSVGTILYLTWLGEESWKRTHPSFIRWLWRW